MAEPKNQHPISCLSDPRNLSAQLSESSLLLLALKRVREWSFWFLLLLRDTEKESRRTSQWFSCERHFYSEIQSVPTVSRPGQRLLCSDDRSKIGNQFLEKHKTITLGNLE